MKAAYTYHIIDHLGDSLNTREAAADFLKEVSANKCDVIELDFKGVNFMSRSFADQFYKRKVKIDAKSEKVIEIINANEHVLKMLNAVKKTQNKTDREYRVLSSIKYSDNNMLNDYLLSV